ncbi:MAG: hypothetical protein ACI9XO_002039 [Paraglaciecola sp.]|jgi:hypothetical protein
MAMERFIEFFRRKKYGALWLTLLNSFHLIYNQNAVGVTL